MEEKITVTFTFRKNEDILELLLFADALKHEWRHIHVLNIPYFPFGRQDRVAIRGECFSLKVICNLINSVGADYVVVTDPHSDVTPALLDNCEIVTQAEVFKDVLNSRTSESREKFYLVAPDGGALKKIYQLSQVLYDCIGVIECSKVRNVKTGEIQETKVHARAMQFEIYDTCIIVDDICDGGRTFIEIAKILKNEKQVKRVVLCVTHGFFTQGLDVFNGLIDEIYTRTGRVK